MATEEKTLDELVAEGRCAGCGTLGGIWHKLGCPHDPENQPSPPDLDAEREDIVADLPGAD